MHKKKNLLEILALVRKFEPAEAVLFQKLFVDRKNHVGTMFNYIDVSFRLYGFSEDTMMTSLLDE